MIAVLATIIVLGVLIFVHEVGHFVAAKLVDVEVQRFSIGLGPVLWGRKWGETEYVLSAIPLGGYVKMGGMEDEVMERLEGGAVEDEEEREPGPRDFDGKPLWARTFVISAGVIMNMLFAFGAYAAGMAFWGLPVLETRAVGEVRAPLLPEGATALSEIPPGARIVRIGDREVEHWGEVQETLREARPGPLTVRFEDPRGQVEIEAPDDPEARRRMAAAVRSWIPAAIDQVMPGSPAAEGGLERGDGVVAVDGTPVATWYEFVDEIEARPGREVRITLTRDGSELTRIVTPREVEQTDPVTGERVTVGQIGVTPPTGEVTYQPVAPVRAVYLGAEETWLTTGFILGFLVDLVTGDVSPRSVGSIVTIGEASGEFFVQGAYPFLRFMALFSINLAILNLLPIPVLDGGHLVFLGIEAVRGRALSIEQRMRWSQVGFFIILGLMIWALSNDFLRILGM